MLSYKIKVKIKKILLITIILAFMLALLLFPDRYTRSCLDGITLWAITVLPSLLPFFFLTQLLTRTGVLNGISYKANKLTRKLFNCSGLSLYAFLMSILSGYPIGSRIVCDLKSNNLITKSEATKIGVLASTSGPLFVIGAVGIGMFNDKIIGFILYFSHIVSAFLLGVAFRNYGKENPLNNRFYEKQNPSNVLYDAIYNAVISVLVVGGFVSIFYVFAEVFEDFKILLPLQKLFEFLLLPFNSDAQTAKAFSVGIIECTKGCSQLSTLSNVKLCASLSSALISFGGISIIMQSLVYLLKAEVKPFTFILAKLLQMVLSFTMSFLLLGFYL